MPSPALANRFLDPKVLASLSRLDLVAKTVVDGFVSGMHRSPDFGFSQEFAEYRAYVPGDDLRHVDWNVYARTERAYLKRYRGETNTELNVLLDASASMGFGRKSVTKFEYAKYLAASIVYLAHLQRDAAGLIVFHDEVENFAPPSSRQGQMGRLMHGIDTAVLGKRTDFAKPFFALQRILKRRGITVVISDFFEKPETIIKTVEPLRFFGTELVLFHLLDPEEIEPNVREPVMLVDLETEEALEVSPDYAKTEYPARLAAHLEELKTKARAAGIDYHFLRTDRPLDEGLREYLFVRQRRK